MKKIYLFMLFSCFFSLASTAMNIKSVTPEEIDLKGDLKIKAQRSLIKPVEAFITGQSIEVDFNYENKFIIK